MIELPDLGVLSDLRERGFLTFQDFILGTLAEMARVKGKDSLVGFMFIAGEIKQFADTSDYVVEQLARYDLRSGRQLMHRHQDHLRLSNFRFVEEQLERLVIAGKLARVNEIPGRVVYRGTRNTEEDLKRLRHVARGYYPLVALLERWLDEFKIGSPRTLGVLG